MWEELSELPHRRDAGPPAGDVSRRIQEILVEFGDYDEEDFQELTEEKLGEMEPHLLLAWCDDHDGMRLGAVPEADINDEQNAWLETLGSTAWVGAEDFDAPGFAAVMRVMSLVASPQGIEHSDVAGLWPWFERETTRMSDPDRSVMPTLEELKALDGRWAGYFRASMKKRFSRVIAIRKST